jgi:hypothetical protein
MALTFALIAPVQSVLYRVYCRNETIQNAPKLYETRQNMSLGSYGLDWVRSFRKIPTRLRGKHFCTNCTSSACFAPSFTAVIKQSQMHLNTMKRAKTWVLGPMGSIGCTHCEKFDATSWPKILHELHKFRPFCTEFQGVTKWPQMHPNTTKCNKTWV